MPGTTCDDVPDAIPLSIVQESECPTNGDSEVEESALKAEGIKCRQCRTNTSSPRCCGGCWQVWYCSRDHQVSDWSKHKRDCKPYKLVKNVNLGRFLVATKPIKFGELIMEDPYLIMGPKMITEPVCLACYKPMTDRPYSCPGCGFPMCDRECSLAESHQPECNAVKDSGSKVKVSVFGEVNCMYECIMPVRILALRDTDPTTWRKLVNLESHEDKRGNTEIAAITQKTVVDIMKGRLNLDYPDELINQVLGIIDTNSFEIRLPDSSIMGVFALGSMLQHSCIPNTHRTFDADLNLVVRASVDIKKGEHLLSCYTESLSTTSARQEHLLTSKFFTCQCVRCSDPTELQTFVSALLCPECIKNKPEIMKKKKKRNANNQPDDDDAEDDEDEIDLNSYGAVVPTDPSFSSSSWECVTCQSPLDNDYVNRMTSVMSEEAEELENTLQTVENCEAFLDKWSSTFHPNHAVFLNIKYALLHLYGNEVGYSLDEMSPLLLLRKENIAREIMKIADVIVPGISRLRGSVLYELYQSIFYKTCSMYQVGIMPDDMARAMAQEAYDCLLQCARILSFEPPVQPEGQLGLEAKEELKNMIRWIQEEGWKD